MSIFDWFRRPRAQTQVGLRSPATWFLEGIGWRESTSGVRINESTALGLSAYYAGINLIAQTISSLPLNVYRKGEGRKRDIAENHPLQRLLHSQPNPNMTAVSLRQMWIGHLIARGNCYGEIVFDSSGTAREIWPLLPNMTVPVPPSLSGGELWYDITMPDTGEHRFLPWYRVIHVPGWTYNGIDGFGLIQLASDAIGLNTSQDTYAARFFRNGGNISGTLDVPTTLKDESFKRLDSEIKTKFSGLTNAHRIAILENGMKFNPINPTHEEAQLIESRRFSVEEWARWLNMPPHKLRELSHATFSNIEHQNIEFVVDTIRPLLEKFEQEFNRKLIMKPNTFYVKHVVDGLLRGDQKSRFDSYAVARNWGWMSANDILELEDRNPLPGDIGDIYLQPMNMVRVDKETAPEEAAAERVLRQEDRTLQTKGIKAAYGAEFQRRVSEWMGISLDKAHRYAMTAAQLQIIAIEQDVTPEEMRRAKAAMLVQMARDGIRYEEVDHADSDAA